MNKIAGIFYSNNFGLQMKLMCGNLGEFFAGQYYSPATIL